MNKFNIYLFIVTLFLQNNASAFVIELFKETPNNSIKAKHIERKSLPLSRLEINGAQEGDVLFFNGVDWMPAPLTGVLFKGTWNPNTNQAPALFTDSYTKNGITVDAVSGEYFIVSHTANNQVFGSDWNRGDWIIFNGEKWERINNTGTVLSIFGNKPHITSQVNDYSWEQLDMASSTIFD